MTEHGQYSTFTGNEETSTASKTVPAGTKPFRHKKVRSALMCRFYGCQLGFSEDPNEEELVEWTAIYEMVIWSYQCKYLRTISTRLL